MDLTDKSQLIDFLRSQGLYTKHSLGQNFLVDREALNKIIEAAEIETDDTVIEVGPGLGTMTGELVTKAKKVIAIELDQKLAELLKSNYESGIMNYGDEKNRDSVFSIHDSRLDVINADILKVNIPEIVGKEKYKVVANIPYYITSKIIKLFLTLEHKPEVIVLLTQKEVAERICAEPGSMSTLSISVQAYGKPEIIDIVPRTSFFPAPEVDSAILRIKVSEFLSGRETEGGNSVTPSLRHSVSEKDFFRLVHIGFASRRKTLVNNLSSGLHLDKKVASDIIKSIGLSENTRAQELSVEKWAELERQVQNS